MSDYRLGKKVVAPTPPKEDVIERTESGLWRVNGKLQTNPPQPKHDPFKNMREVLRRAQQAQEDDGLDITFMGWM